MIGVFGLAAIFAIADKRMTHGRSVGANLMRASRARAKGHPCKALADTGYFGKISDRAHGIRVATWRGPPRP